MFPRPRHIVFLIYCISVLLPNPGIARQMSDSSQVLNIRYGSKGFEFQTLDNRFLLQVQSRLQFRFATPDDEDPTTFDDLNGEGTPAFKINRARLKVGGHAFNPNLKYYWEYELGKSSLLDFRIMYEAYPWLNIKVGQWKSEFTRERFISSGSQQMVDRSLINRYFTLDRQQGVTVYGHLDGQGLLDFNYWAAVHTGTGRSNYENDDNHFMYVGKWQWNFLGREVEFEGSDLDIHKEPAGIIAIAGATNRSPYTRFSTSGGGSLNQFIAGAPGQYRVTQFNIETVFVYKGFSWQSELHQKEVIDKLNNDSSVTLRGYYLQSGYFFNQLLDWWPEPLELVARHSKYIPDSDVSSNYGTENSIALNWFFSGHKNKLTMELSNFIYEGTPVIEENELRFRIQWDISL